MEGTDFGEYVQEFIRTAPVQELEVFAMHREHWLMAQEFNVRHDDSQDDDNIFRSNN